MKILQLDVDNITYEPVKPEAPLYDDIIPKKVSIDDILVVMISVEKGDNEQIADKALKDTESYLGKLARKKVIFYPYAHLSNNLAPPKEAMHILEYMFKNAPKGIESFKAPFGWTKKPIIAVKGHPLAEQFRSYGAEGEEKIYKKAKPMSVNTSIVRKSDWAGLPDTDHRTIGEKLDLFSFQEVSPSMVYWHPNGYTIYKQLMQFIREMEEEYDNVEIQNPAVANIALWQVSGHYDHYKENMFMFDADMGPLGLKPMNCPSTMLVYKSKKWSYRDLPFRTVIFDKLYRKEVRGALTGLFRVMELTQDDGHFFMREDQLEHETEMLLEFVKRVYDSFGMKFIAKLSTMPDDHMGDDKLWEKATGALKMALEKNKMKYEIKEKEGAFYGPKIDFDIYDSMGRAWQCGTIQIDYQQPLRFGLEYTGEDGKAKTPVVIHRAVLGSLERFTAILVEHYKGKFPTWIAPIQVAVISISESQGKYAESVYKELKKRRIRAVLDISGKTLEYKIRDAKMKEIPYTLILGKKEEDAKTVSVRNRNNKQKNQLQLEDFINTIEKEIKERSNDLSYN